MAYTGYTGVYLVQNVLRPALAWGRERTDRNTKGRIIQAQWTAAIIAAGNAAGL